MAEIKNILFPVDFTEASERVASYARLFAEKFEARLYVVFIVEDIMRYAGFYVPHAALEKLEKELLEGAQKRMEDFVSEHLSGLEVEPLVLTGEVAAKICEVAREKGIDLIIMGTHGRKGLERALFGSVAEKVVKTAPCPVLTVNPFQKRG
ncbi:universal stress protein [Thermosulfurimonas sp. F29]|uniref:universal stress protein n=1 Tax=Thermosulfurimonas sp. F29 TaxID=2867247 RepID=UPI001C83201D|nr:universal stress protein [Thermosulfurimonas sp. F29]MBX6423776.1 universal stress protein [Thermosulfurimonas sp. F29]